MECKDDGSYKGDCFYLGLIDIFGDWMHSGVIRTELFLRTPTYKTVSLVSLPEWELLLKEKIECTEA